MKYLIQLFWLAVIAAQSATAMESQKSTLDISKMWLQYPHNARDNYGNTFWHQLARGSDKIQDWPEVMRLEKRFKERHKYWTPNPFIKNNNNRTARKEAKDVFKRSNNPVAGWLAEYLKGKEASFLQIFTIKEYRDAMPTAQYLDYDLVECLSPEQVIATVAKYGVQEKRPERPWHQKWR